MSGEAASPDRGHEPARVYPFAGTLKLASGVLDELVSLAKAGLPNEVCGVAGGTRGEGDGSGEQACDEVSRLYPLTNLSASHEHFSVDPAEQWAAYRSMREEGLESIAVYHSHPETPARPSSTDVAEAHDPDVTYVIVSLASDEPSVRAFTIIGGIVGELRIEPGGQAP